MPDIMIILACLSQSVEPTALRQMGRVIEAMLAISGRVTMKGGSYRTIPHSSGFSGGAVTLSRFS
jgi:hypothetical protein